MPKVQPPTYYRAQIYFSSRDPDQMELYAWLRNAWRSYKKLNGELADSDSDMVRDLIARAKRRQKPSSQPT